MNEGVSFSITFQDDNTGNLLQNNKTKYGCVKPHCGRVNTFFEMAKPE